MMSQLFVKTSTALKREPGKDFSLLDECDRMIVEPNMVIAVNQLEIDADSNHWKFELAQPMQGQERLGTWYAYTEHVSLLPGTIATPALPAIVRHHSAELVATQDTFLKRSIKKQASALVSCDKLPLNNGQHIRVKQVLDIVRDPSTGDHWCFQLDGQLGHKSRPGFWYAWVPAFTFYCLDTYAADADQGQANLIQA